MVGEGVLHISLNNPEVSSVLVLGRRSCGVSHPKLSELILDDIFNISAVEASLIGFDACFFCLGTTSIGKSEQEYTKTTYTLTMNVATVLCKVNPGMTFCYVSGEGTDSSEQGRIRWARIKGKTENDLQKLGFKAVYNFRPGFIKPIHGMKNTLSFAKPILFIYPLIKFLLPSHECTLEELGRAMIKVSREGFSKNILENVDISHIGKA